MKMVKKHGNLFPFSKDTKPIRAFVLHMTKTSLGHYQMVYNSIQITTDRKLQQICKITQTLVYLSLTSMNFCKMFVFLNT